jgi:hypothetical protein
VAEEVGRLPAVLRAGGADANAALRRLTGGGIVVREATAAGRKRSYLVGTVTLRVRGVVGPIPPVGMPSEAGDADVPVEIHFRDAPPWAPLAQRVKDGIDAGKEYDRVAAALNCPPHWVAKALAWWHAERGLRAADGRTLRARLGRSAEAAAVDEKVMTLWNEGLPIQEIAAEVGVCRDTVTAVVRRWHEDRGLKVPDGRHRRRDLNCPGAKSPPDDRAEGPGSRAADRPGDSTA